MIAVLPAAGFREGRWLNGMGVSWDIAAEPREAGAAHFDWRFAIARIDADVPFSRYASVDRIFTLIAGEGLTLDLDGQAPLVIDRRFVPHAFPGDVTTSCRLKSGPCRALNLFLARGAWDFLLVKASTISVAMKGIILYTSLGMPRSLSTAMPE